jgi:predicted metal-binding protein
MHLRLRDFLLALESSPAPTFDYNSEEMNAYAKYLRRYPDRARPSMEACGIDVFTTARSQSFPLKVLRSRKEKGNYYGLLLLE